MTRKIPWIGTSWKMHKTRPEALAYARALAASAAARTDAARLFVIPPFTAIADVAAALAGTKVRVGAQNMHWADAGAWTGEVSPPMLKDAGATLVEIGHSERRAHFGETDDTVALKTAAAVAHGLLALVCVGETRDEYDAKRTAAVLARQVGKALSRVGRAADAAIVIAYEPVWSIGEHGIPADPDFADAQQALIKAGAREILGREIDVLYGGSVNPDNCRQLAGKPHIDGLFIGRAAWQAEGYVGIVEQVIESLAGGG